MNRKKFEVEKNNVKEIKSLYEISNMYMSDGFMAVLKKLNINESIYHNDTMKTFKRIE